MRLVLGANRPLRLTRLTGGQMRGLLRVFPCRSAPSGETLCDAECYVPSSRPHGGPERAGGTPVGDSLSQAQQRVSRVSLESGSPPCKSVKGGANCQAVQIACPSRFWRPAFWLWGSPPAGRRKRSRTARGVFPLPPELHQPESSGRWAGSEGPGLCHPGNPKSMPSAFPSCHNM